MKRVWVLLVPILGFAVAGLIQYKFRMDHSTETYSAVAEEMISAWRSRHFTSLTNIAPLRSVLVYNGGVKLEEGQTDSLQTTVGAWFLAYSAGTESAYLGFDFRRVLNGSGRPRHWTTSPAILSVAPSSSPRK